MGSSRGAAPSPLDPRGFRGPGRLARGGLKAQPSPEPACPDPAPQTQEQLLEQRRNVESIFTETCYHTHIPPPHTHHTIYPTHIYRVHTYVAYLHVYTQHTYPCPIHTPPHISTTHNTYVQNTLTIRITATHSAQTHTRRRLFHLPPKKTCPGDSLHFLLEQEEGKHLQSFSQPPDGAKSLGEILYFLRNGGHK